MKDEEKNSKQQRKSYFVTGTDTGVGKTLVSTALLNLAGSRGLKTIGLKPVAAGAEKTDNGAGNEDALAIAAEANVRLSYQQVNPVLLEAPIAPHIAAAKEGRTLSSERIVGYCRGALMQPYDFCIVEGAGGWRVPLGPRESMADVAKGLSFPVILVVGLRLGCLNHALLSAEAIARDGLRVAAWVANLVDPNMMMRAENLETLRSCFPFPMLGEIPYLEQPCAENAAGHLDISKIL